MRTPALSNHRAARNRLGRWPRWRRWWPVWGGLVWRAVEGAGPRATSDVPLVAVEAELHFHSRLELPTPGLISRRVNSIGEGLTQWQSELGYPVADVKQSVVSLLEAVSLRRTVLHVVERTIGRTLGRLASVETSHLGRSKLESRRQRGKPPQCSHCHS